MSWHTIADGDNGTANIIMDCLRWAGCMGFSYFYTMDANGAYAMQDIGHTGYEVGNVYLGTGKKIYIGGQEFVGGSGTSSFTTINAICNMMQKGLDGSILHENYVAQPFNFTNSLTLTLGKAYATTDTTSIYLDANALSINACNAYTDWTAGTNTPTLANDTTAGHYVEGTGGVSLTKASLNGSVDAYITGLWNLTNRNARLWVYPSATTNLTKITIKFESTAGNTKTFDFLVAGLTGATLNHLHCDFDRADGTTSNITITTAGTFVRGSISKIYIGYTTGSAQTLTITYDFLRAVDNFGIVNSQHGGLCLPIYDGTNQEDMIINSESAYPLNGKYVLNATLSNNYALGTFSSTAVFAKLLSGTITQQYGGGFDTAGSGTHAKTVDYIDRCLSSNSVSGKKLYLTASFVADAFRIYDFPSTTTLRIYNPDVATDYTTRFKNTDKVVMFKLQRTYPYNSNYYNSTLVAGWKILTLTADSTFSTPYTTLTHANDSNATGGDTSDWYIVRLAVFLKYFTGTLTASESYSTLTPTVFIPQGGYTVPNISGLIQWHKADDMGTTYANGATVTSWADRGSNNNVLDSHNGTPLFYNNIQNGLPAVYYDGSSRSYAGTNGADTAQPVTIFVVARPTSWGTGGEQDSFAGSPSGIIMGKIASATGAYLYAGSQTSGASPTNNTTFLETAIVNGASSSIYVNNGTATAVSCGTNAYGNYQMIGANSSNACNFIGYVMEVMVYASALSSAQLYQVWDYLNRKWGIWTAGTPTQQFLIGGVAENQSGAKLCVRAQLTRQDTTNDNSYVKHYGGMLS